MSDKKVNVLVYSGMLILTSHSESLQAHDHQETVPLWSLYATVYGLSAACCLHTMQSSPSQEKPYFVNHGLRRVCFS